MKVNIKSAMYHAVIKTQYVFADNNQVYLKKQNYKKSKSGVNNEEWYPINFKWKTI